MKVLIEISEKLYKNIVEDTKNGYIGSDIWFAVANGTPYNPTEDYSQGWHDAITKALKEAYTITIEDGSFKVVQAETLEGLGMVMPDKEEDDNENLNQDTV